MEERLITFRIRGVLDAVSPTKKWECTIGLWRSEVEKEKAQEEWHILEKSIEELRIISDITVFQKLNQEINLDF